MTIDIPSQYVDKIITLTYSILRIDYKALGDLYEKDTELTEDDINNKEYYYIWLDDYIIKDDVRKQTVLKCNITAKQLIDIIETNPTYEQLVNSAYDLYKDDPEVSESGTEVINSVNEFLNELSENNLINLIDVETSQNASGSYLDIDIINNSNNYSMSNTNDSTDAINDNSSEDSISNSDLFSDNTLDYGKEIDGVDYDYLWRIRNSFKIVKINDYYYAIPFVDKESARYFIKLNEVAAIAVECFKNLTNRQTIIDKLSESFPNESSEDIFAAATYVYNQMWIGFDVGSHYETNKDTEGDS